MTADVSTADAATDVAKVVLDPDAAREVVDLIDDQPGSADEALLDDVLEALAEAGPYVPTDDQQRAASGEAVAIELTADAADAVETLIVADDVVRPKLLRHTRDRLVGKLQRARRKAKRS